MTTRTAPSGRCRGTTRKNTPCRKKARRGLTTCGTCLGPAQSADATSGTGEASEAAAAGLSDVDSPRPADPRPIPLSDIRTLLHSAMGNLGQGRAPYMRIETGPEGTRYICAARDCVSTLIVTDATAISPQQTAVNVNAAEFRSAISRQPRKDVDITGVEIASHGAVIVGDVEVDAISDESITEMACPGRAAQQTRSFANAYIDPSRYRLERETIFERSMERVEGVESAPWEGATVASACEDFNAMASFAAEMTSYNSRPILECVLFESEENGGRMVATDACQVGWRPGAPPTPGNQDLLISATGLRLFADTAKRFHGKQSEQVAVAVGGSAKAFTMSSGPVTVVTDKMPGVFPTWEPLVKTKRSRIWTGDATALVETADASSKAARKHTKQSYPMRFTVTRGAPDIDISMSVQTDDDKMRSGALTEVHSGSLAGKQPSRLPASTVIGISPPWLKTCAQNAAKGTVTLQAQGTGDDIGTKPILLTGCTPSASPQEVLSRPGSVMMPVRLS